MNSAADVDWLVDKFDLDLSLVARLGGHSQPRTHRGKERFPGMTITYALIQMLEKACTRSRCHRDHHCDVFSVDRDSFEMNRFYSAPSQLHLFQVCPRCLYSVYISHYISLLILHQVAEKTTRARIVTKAEVYKLVQNGRSVVGCEYRKAGKSVKDRETYQGPGDPSKYDDQPLSWS